MTPVNGPHWLLRLKVYFIASASREMWSLFPSPSVPFNVDRMDRSPLEPGSLFRFSFISPLLLVHTEPGLSSYSVSAIVPVPVRLQIEVVVQRGALMCNNDGNVSSNCPYPV